jgi:putative ABC transport system permease protein
MTWIALKMLTGDRAKFLGIVMGLTFAALLITQQGSIFCGLMCRTAGQIFDITGADLWVMDPNVRFVDDVKPMLETNLYRVRGVEGVEWAVPLYKGIARAKLNSTGFAKDPITRAILRDPDTGQPKFKDYEVIEQVILLGLDDSSMVGAPPAERILAGTLADLRRPDAVIVDFTRLKKLYPGEDWSKETAPGRSVHPQEGAEPIRFYDRFLGRELEMNDHRAVIVGVCVASRTFQSNAVVYTTFSRAKLFVPRERKILTYILAKTDRSKFPTPPEPTGWAAIAAWPSDFVSKLLGQAKVDPVAEAVAARIKSQTGLQARTSPQFIWDTIWYFMTYTGIPINFGITVALGFLVGTAIAGQTFYNFTLENLKQFGALKAMGTSNTRIIGMILIQATVTGLLGYGLGVGLASLFGVGNVTNPSSELAYYTPWQLLPIAGLAVLLICILASLISVRRVIVLEPAVVFRG